ncbi:MULTISPECIES: hypothetical protein [unclassified Curtobacterium]|uniref:hypothetical protein n=1 Tax=unclassified Curtobacterium TaxID=257496 RepID=UPI000D853664|nr:MULTISPECIES: hypothetical protein [unclassified Curtobacterium]PYY43389.1 hypothetical protein DEJ32_01605 [Curtobacterium sp. MCPF17_046]WIB17004.1 hypothetical protein DEJ34_07745 [Curtobacterium sp. MCPF17_050]
MATLTARERDRRANRYLLGTIAVVAVITSAVLHRPVLSSDPVAFWLPTAAGLAYGSGLWFLGERQDSKWLSNLTWAGWLVVFWVLLWTKVVSGPAWFLAVIAGGLAVTAAFPRKTKPSKVDKVPLAAAKPWSGSDVTAEPTTHTFGRRTVPAVTITTRDGATRFRVSELAGFFDKETDTVESIPGERLTFLTRVGVAAPDSVIGEATAGLPDDTLVLIDEKDDSRPAAVIVDEDAVTFEHWVRTLPED